MSLRASCVLTAGLVWAALPGATAAPPKPLALHPDNPHYFLFRGKPTVLVTSGEHYGAVLNLDFDYDPFAKENRTLARRHSNLSERQVAAEKT